MTSTYIKRSLVLKEMWEPAPPGRAGIALGLISGPIVFPTIIWVFAGAFIFGPFSWRAIFAILLLLLSVLVPFAVSAHHGQRLRNSGSLLVVKIRRGEHAI